MKLSLSVRVAETASKRDATHTFEQLTELAAGLGYEAVCMRASQVGIHSPLEQITAARKQAALLNLKVSMVTGDFPVPLNNEQGPDGLRNITPYLDLTELLGADLIRIAMKVEADIPWAQRAADEAAERDIRLAHQSHTQSLFETVAGSVDVLKRVGRENFGIIYEPANLDLCAQDYGVETLKTLFTLSFQRLSPEPYSPTGGKNAPSDMDPRCSPTRSDPLTRRRGHRLSAGVSGPGSDRLRRVCDGASGVPRDHGA